MLDSGFSLSRVELLNWGNFHGYQKFSLYEGGDAGPLFQPPPASAILGINGSGKSTLIDALMIVLLPFEGSLKLGVTNDVEAGSGGGRTIRDYVLGKHSSHSGVISDPSAIFGRKDGCSMIVLNFVHNRHADRQLSLGRAWWYQNYKVSDTQVALLSYQRLAISDLCMAGKTPATPKAFRQHVKAAHGHVQLFETMQSYFTAASQGLGRISRDDLKILNRTFFVKSISNIDQFIRENMLVEQDSPNLDRLLENVRNGQEIAFSIETCEAKIAAIARIVRELTRLVEFIEAGRKAEGRLRLLRLHREWSDWRDLVKQRDELTNQTGAIQARLPQAISDAEDAMAEWRAAHNRLLTDDVELRLGTIDSEVRSLEERIQWKSHTLRQWAEKAKELDWRLPASENAWTTFIEAGAEEISGARGRAEELAAECEELREKRYLVDAQARACREELEHISRSGTLLSRDLCGVRDAAVKALGISAHHLMFVGELLQVRRESRDLRTAVESVLFPIARNLLCHPDHLQALTRWLDAEGLKSDVTVKRITAEELASAHEGTDEDELEVDGPQSILRALEMRSSKEHPFSGYLWRWLRDSFDYEVVDVKRFKSEVGRLVTAEGLVKKDSRTMRKLKRGFAFSLGWDNSERLEQLGSELVKLQDERTGLQADIEGRQKESSRCEERARLMAEIKDRCAEVGGVEGDRQRIKGLESERQTLLDRHPNHGVLRQRVLDLDQKAQALTRARLTLESDLAGKRSLLTKVEGLIPSRENEFKGSKLYMELCRDLDGEENLFAALTNVQSMIERRGISRLQMEGEVAEEAQKAEQGRGRAISMAAVNLGNYRHSFNDPNLPYELGSEIAPETFLREWAGADKRLRETELPSAQEKWRRFFDQVLLDSVKDMINEIKSRVFEAGETVRSINEVLKLTNFEDLVTDQRYLRIEAQTSADERIRKFRKQMNEAEKTLSPAVRARIESQSQEIMGVLTSLVDQFQKDPAYRAFVTDVRNHFQFSVQSLRRSAGNAEDEIVEAFSGSRKDAKSSAQTTQLAYALLASCLAYRFRFHDPVGGADTPRLIVFDEFGGKFDNEKPREILKLLDKMGFQSLLVSPMSKADLLADGISHLTLVHKVSASHSKVQSYKLQSREDYERLLTSARSAHEAEEPALV